MILEHKTREFLVRATKGNEAAINLCRNYIRVADIWDNLFDKDVEVTKEEIVELMWLCHVCIPSNAFFQQHATDLTPVLASGILNWTVANKFEESGVREQVIKAHNLRYQVGSVLYMVITLCGNNLTEAMAIGPELWNLLQPETLEEFLKEKGV